jgi:hypothetical protein
MPAGDIFNGRLAVTATRATLDALVGAGAKTYAYASFKRLDGAPAIGNVTVTFANGLEFTDLSISSGTIVGANINLIGPATVEFFGITSA